MNATGVFASIRAFGEHEHLELARGLDRIHEAGRTIGRGTSLDDIRALDEVLRWSTATLEPHIAWEESWLYPQIEALTKTPWSTRAARVDHAQISGLAIRLRRDVELAADGRSPDAIDGVRSDLYGYEALVRAHLDREERLLLPVLTDDLAADEWAPV